MPCAVLQDVIRIGNVPAARGPCVIHPKVASCVGDVHGVWRDSGRGGTWGDVLIAYAARRERACAVIPCIYSDIRPITNAHIAIMVRVRAAISPYCIK